MHSLHFPEGKASAERVNTADLLQRGFQSCTETRACPRPGLGMQLLSLPPERAEDGIRNRTRFATELQGLSLCTLWP